MATLKLTIKKIKSFTYEGAVRVDEHGREAYDRDVRWDTEVSGLGLRIYPTGRKTFLLSYRVLGRKRMIALGRFGDMTLDQARDAARKKVALVRDGKDPLEEKRQAGRGSTLGDLMTAYIEEYAKPRKKTWKADERCLRLYIPAGLKSRDARTIKQWEVAKLHREVGKSKPYAANRLIEVIRRMYNIAPTLIAIDGSVENPTKGVERFQERKRKRWAKPEEVAAIARAIDREANIYARGLVWLYLLTGARRNELLTAKRSELDWQRGQLRLSDTKSGEEQHVTLSAHALAIIQALPVLERNPYLFPGKKRGQHFTNINQTWDHIRDRATVILWAAAAEKVSELVTKLTRKMDREPQAEEVEAVAVKRNITLQGDIRDLWLHDLRRSVGSWMTQAGVDLNIIKDGLRHADLGTTLIYARLGSDSAREAFEEHGRRIMEAAGKSRPVEVVGGDGHDE